MYLRTPKKYSGRDSRKRLISLRWLWLYLLAPVVIIGAVLVYDYRDQLGPQLVDPIVNNLPKINFNAPTATPTIPGPLLRNKFASALQSGNVQQAIDTLNELKDLEPNNVTMYSLLTRLLTLRLYTFDQTDLASPIVKAQLDAAINAGKATIDANPEAPDGWA